MDAYQHWVVALSTPTDLRRILLSFPYLSIAERKHVLSLCRCQVPPIDGSPLRRQIGIMMKNQVLIPPGPLNVANTEYYDFGDLLFSIAEHVSKPISCALLSLGIRIAPYAETSWYEEFIRDSYQKELAASVMVYMPVRFDFTCIISDMSKDRHRPFSPRLVHNSETASSVYEDLCRARQSIRNQVLWPDIGTKTVGLDCSTQFWDLYHQYNCTFKDEDPEGVTCADLTKLYIETGEWSVGVVEMRSAWKYHDLKPRVYFARGGDTFIASMYIQEIFNIVLDQFPECHRINRFQEPEDAKLEIDDVSLIYDYASFTSTLEEIKDFIEALSHFFLGVQVTIIDPKNGPTSADVGEMLGEYNTVCNNYPEFDVSGLADFQDRFKHTCGMLGVPGNIFSCTLLHAIHLRFLAGPRRSRTVGDDGKLYAKIQNMREDVEELHHRLQSIGELQQEKMFVFAYIDLDLEDIQKYTYQFIKRPYFRLESFMQTGRLLVMPNPVELLGFSDDLHTQSQAKTVHDRIKKYRKQLDRLLVKIPLECSDLEDSEKRLLQKFIQSVVRKLKIKIARHEDSESLSRMLKSISPDIPDEFMDMTTEGFRLSQYDLDEEFMVPEPWDHNDFQGFDIGCEWKVRPSKPLSFLQKLGYIEGGKVLKKISRSEYGDHCCLQFLRFDYIPLSAFTVIKKIPSWCPMILLNG
jgi:hypothetical protein